ncbi:sigma-70 family RNA polymerase sigma factor [Urbifossiella limnaea]|uniref:RNA polymerase sigma factor RpoE n=1 Tax=Urbifossiella limnaea TaxID=2528023 RepID=A0A517Y289_9BACT|nr:sigma-70 family RNA polymerase sigma factor [Urbifossiella limnaea]QDU23849.1 RNA polymerase sigma factor RpoE [Urbifossiella limnaea]
MSPSPESAVSGLAAARAGDTAALGRLLESYRSYLLLLARIQIGRRLQSKADPADVVQDTFLDAHRQFPAFRGETADALAAWLRRVLAGQLAHLVRRYFGTEARDVRLEQSIEQELDSSSQSIARGLSHPGTSPSESAARREDLARLGDALERLTPDYRDVILLRQLEGLPFAEVARRMGRTEDAVQKLWVRGLVALRRALDGSP